MTFISNFKDFTKKHILIFLFLGFSASIPFGLLGSTFTIWLTEKGVSIQTTGALSLILLPYALKIFWAPCIDHISLPFTSFFKGRKKTWGLYAQSILIFSLCTLALSNSQNKAELTFVTCFFAFLTSFASATQDIVIDALRIDVLKKNELGEGTSAYQLGYRIGLLLSTAGAIAFSNFISWKYIYMGLALCTVVGMCSLYLLKENSVYVFEKKPFFEKVLITPFRDFVVHHKHFFLILLFILFYKLSNIILGRVAHIFYLQNFSKETIATISGIYGFFITILGLPLGGIFIKRFGILPSLFWLGFLEIGTSIAFSVLSLIGSNIPLFVLIITFDNLVGGMGTAVFITYLSSLCSKSFSATQYALLSSFMAIATSVFSSTSGYMAAALGWPLFFIATGLFMLPALTLLKYMKHKGIS